MMAVGEMENWPDDGLEYLDRCPVCGSVSRVLMHESLQDKVFFCAPGIWTMWRCNSCRSGYIDPRPTIETISLAYENYYTHSESGSGKRAGSRFPLSLVAKLRKRIRPAYFNTRYGYRLTPALGPFDYLSGLFPRKFTLSWDDYIRHLPFPTPGSRLLDVGCGNGDFLHVADNLGYVVTGIEVDPSAVKAARVAGFEVKIRSLPKTGMVSGMYDHITLNHVLEHLHDPPAGLQEIYRLLRPGGRLWMQFPNIDSCGHEIYGPSWRGLEPPRHLIMPSLYGARKMLHAAGFTKITLLKSKESVDSYFERSDEVQRFMHSATGNGCRVSGSARKAAKRTERRCPEKHEHLTLIAFKDPRS